MIARTAVSQVDQVGNRTHLSCYWLERGFFKQADRHITEGVRPTVVAEGFDRIGKMPSQLMCASRRGKAQSLTSSVLDNLFLPAKCARRTRLVYFGLPGGSQLWRLES